VVVVVVVEVVVGLELVVEVVVVVGPVVVVVDVVVAARAEVLPAIAAGAVTKKTLTSSSFTFVGPAV
jgi:hypothetical protein